MWPFESISVLLVENERVTIRIVGDLLRGLGFTDIDVADSAPAAFRTLQEKKSGLLVADWDLPGSGGGLGLLRSVRAGDDFKRTSFIMTSGQTAWTDVKLACYSGADGFLLKPFTSETLGAKIDSAFRKRSPNLRPPTSTAAAPDPRPKSGSRAHPLLTIRS